VRAERRGAVLEVSFWHGGRIGNPCLAHRVAFPREHPPSVLVAGCGSAGVVKAIAVIDVQFHRMVREDRRARPRRPWTDESRDGPCCLQQRRRRSIAKRGLVHRHLRKRVVAEERLADERLDRVREEPASEDAGISPHPALRAVERAFGVLNEQRRHVTMHLHSRGQEVAVQRFWRHRHQEHRRRDRRTERGDDARQIALRCLGEELRFGALEPLAFVPPPPRIADQSAPVGRAGLEQQRDRQGRGKW
jgi:hypothetical protein